MTYYINENRPKNKERLLTSIMYLWNICIIILCIIAISKFYSYLEHYTFKSKTFFVTGNVYHLSDEDIIADHVDINNIVKIKGYKIKQSDYYFCEKCSDFLSEIEEELEKETSAREYRSYRGGYRR